METKQVTVNVKWRMSKQARQDVAVQTGRMPAEQQEFKIDLVDLTSEQRESILRVTECFRNVDVSDRVEFDAKEKFHDYLKHESVLFDAQPSVDAVVKHCIATAGERVFAEVHKRKLAEEARREYEANLARWLELRTALDMLIEARDYDRLNTFARDHNAGDLLTFEPERIEGERRTFDKRISEAMREIRAERAAAEMRAWVEAHGSAHLKKCIDGGYHCERLYALERARAEYPAFELDFYDCAAWKGRSNPTEAALDLAAAVGGKVVWLTKPGDSTPPEDEDDDDDEGYFDADFQECEAVVIRNFLGKYDLIQII